MYAQARNVITSLLKQIINYSFIGVDRQFCIFSDSEYCLFASHLFYNSIFHRLQYMLRCDAVLLCAMLLPCLVTSWSHCSQYDQILAW